MSTATQRSAKQQLRISSYDRASSWLLTFLIIASITVGALLAIFFSSKIPSGDNAIPVNPVSAGGGGTGGSGPPGTGNDLEPPGADEVRDLSEPELQDTLNDVAAAVTTKSAILADEKIDLGIEPTEGTGKGDRRRPGFGGGSGGGSGGGIGSGFGRGRGGPGEPRREIRFDAADLQEYALWLDYFKIELGLLGQDNQVYYAYNLSHEKPDVRVGDPAQEQRLYMNPTASKFAALDRRLVEKAGIGDKGAIVLQFYPAEAQAILYRLEQAKAGNRKLEQIRSTAFRVTRSGTTFEFSVEEQTYR